VKADRLKKYGSPDDLCGFSDSDWGGDESRCSVTGYVWFLHGGLIDWRTQKQKTVALSSTEAEYMALSRSVQNGLFLRTCQREFEKGTPISTTTISADNHGAISLSSNASNHSRAKHIDIRYHFMREHINSGAFRINWVPGAQNTADALTKALDRPTLTSHVLGLGLVLSRGGVL
jgi:hypothetical protein